MGVAQVKSWKTSDGRHFDDEATANAHEEAFQTRKIISGRVKIIREKINCGQEVALKLASHWIEITGAIEEAGLD